jgi:hypothetical protein
MNRKQSKFWWIDTLLFAGFLLAFFLSFTGLELHQWIGVIGGLLAGYHLLVHWDWFDRVSQRFFQGASHNVRLKYLLDSSLLVGFVGIIGTGLVISSWLNLTLTNTSSWLAIHILVSIVTLLVLVTKLVLHWKWIARTTRSTFTQPQLSLVIPTNRQPVRVHAEAMDRGEFLKVMGVAGGASLLALLSASKSLAVLQSEATTTVVQSTSTDSTAQFSSSSGLPQFGSNVTPGSTTCSLQCGKRCTFPGRCRRYTDADGDNYCDLGECA